MVREQRNDRSKRGATTSYTADNLESWTPNGRNIRTKETTIVITTDAASGERRVKWHMHMQGQDNEQIPDDVGEMDISRTTGDGRVRRTTTD